MILVDVHALQLGKVYDFEVDEDKTADELLGDIVTLIKCDTMDYRRFYLNKAVKKTLTIPEWLNIEATAKGYNFSAVLQEALRERLGISDII